MIHTIKKRMLELSATILNYFALYGFNYRKLLSDVTYEKIFSEN